MLLLALTQPVVNLSTLAIPRVNICLLDYDTGFEISLLWSKECKQSG